MHMNEMEVRNAFYEMSFSFEKTEGRTFTSQFLYELCVAVVVDHFSGTLKVRTAIFAQRLASCLRT